MIGLLVKAFRHVVKPFLKLQVQYWAQAVQPPKILINSIKLRYFYTVRSNIDGLLL